MKKATTVKTASVVAAKNNDAKKALLAMRGIEAAPEKALVVAPTAAAPVVKAKAVKVHTAPVASATVRDTAQASAFVASFAALAVDVPQASLDALNALRGIAPMLKGNGRVNALGHKLIDNPKNAAFDGVLLALCMSAEPLTLDSVKAIHARLYNVPELVDTNGKVGTIAAWFAKGRVHFKHLAGKQASNTLAKHCLPRVGYAVSEAKAIAAAIENAAPVLGAILGRACKAYAAQVKVAA